MWMSVARASCPLSRERPAPVSARAGCPRPSGRDARATKRMRHYALQNSVASSSSANRHPKFLPSSGSAGLSATLMGAGLFTFAFCTLPFAFCLLPFCSARARSFLYFPRGFIPKLAQRLSTFFLTSGSMTISSGQGRAKPSVGHLRVASIPIFEPKLGRREACSS